MKTIQAYAKSLHFVTCLLVLWGLMTCQLRAEQVSLSGTQLRSIHSEHTAQDYQLLINLPQGFDSSKSYPVIYVLDAQWDFPLISATYGQLYYDGFVPAAVVVGITWGKDDDPNVKRVRDFTPSKVDGQTGSGGAANFLRFIKTELIPFVQQEYGDNGQRVLIGSSLGGLFTLYSLFHEPQLFSAYLPSASASGWDNQVLYQLAKSQDASFRAALLRRPIKLYSAVGELDDLKADFTRLQRFFAQQDYSGLALNTEVIPDLGHAGIKSVANLRGLQYAFQQANLPLSVDDVRGLLGQYQSADGAQTVTLSWQDGQLILIRQQQKIQGFRYAGDHQFYQHGHFYRLKFDQSAANTPILTVERFAGVETLHKIRP